LAFKRKKERINPGVVFIHGCAIHSVL
jgi:hypothetical protein